MRGNRKVALGVIVVAGAMTMGGCTNYWKVTDPASGRTYYTTKLKKAKHSGAIEFEDQATGKLIILSASEREKITKADYRFALGQ